MLRGPRPGLVVVVVLLLLLAVGAMSAGGRRGGAAAPYCRGRDVAYLAHAAPLILEAKLRSMGLRGAHRSPYALTIEVTGEIKGPRARRPPQPPQPPQLPPQPLQPPQPHNERLTVPQALTQGHADHCAPDIILQLGQHDPQHRLHQQIKLKRRYIVFAARDSLNLRLVGPLLPFSKSNRKTVQRMLAKRIERPQFDKSRYQETVTIQGNRPLRLICRTRGFPPPEMHWYKDGRKLLPLHHYQFRIRKYRSVLKIKKPNRDDVGRYECRARGMDDNDVISIPFEVAMPAFDVHDLCHVSKEYCFNGGTCARIANLKEVYCECPDGFGGDRCSEKIIPNPSTFLF